MRTSLIASIVRSARRPANRLKENKLETMGWACELLGDCGYELALIHYYRS